jgi:hypothetical protein
MGLRSELSSEVGLGDESRNVQGRAAVLAGIILFIAGCQPRGSVSEPLFGPFVEVEERLSAQLSEGDADILEVVFRDCLRDVREGEVCFVSRGFENGVWVDAPESFLRRLADLNLDLNRPSEARIPRRGEWETDGTVREKSSGREGSIYWVRITKRRSDREVEVVAGRLNGMMEGSGQMGVVRREGGRWVNRWHGFVSQVGKS